MRYKIEINLFALHQLGSEISLEEAVLLDYVYWLCTSPSDQVEKMRIERDGKKYTWFDYKFYIRETPILRGKTKATITPKLKAIEDEKFVETFIDEKTSRKFVRVLSKCDTLFRNLNGVVKKTKRGTEGGPFRKLNIDNKTIDNQTRDNTLAPQSGAGKEINDLIELFKVVNPSYKTLFPNNTQRKALERMVKEHSREKIEWVVKNLPKTNGIEFAPTITTPLELERKLGKLIAYYQRKKSEAGKSRIVIL